MITTAVKTTDTGIVLDGVEIAGGFTTINVRTLDESRIGAILREEAWTKPVVLTDIIVDGAWALITLSDGRVEIVHRNTPIQIFVR